MLVKLCCCCTYECLGPTFAADRAKWERFLRARGLNSALTLKYPCDRYRAASLGVSAEASMKVLMVKDGLVVVTDERSVENCLFQLLWSKIHLRC